MLFIWTGQNGQYPQISAVTIHDKPGANYDMPLCKLDAHRHPILFLICIIIIPISLSWTNHLFFLLSLSPKKPSPVFRCGVKDGLQQIPLTQQLHRIDESGRRKKSDGDYPIFRVKNGVDFWWEYILVVVGELMLEWGGQNKKQLQFCLWRCKSVYVYLREGNETMGWQEILTHLNSSALQHTISFVTLLGETSFMLIHIQLIWIYADYHYRGVVWWPAVVGQ